MLPFILPPPIPLPRKSNLLGELWRRCFNCLFPLFFSSRQPCYQRQFKQSHRCSSRLMPPTPFEGPSVRSILFLNATVKEKGSPPPSGVKTLRGNDEASSDVGSAPAVRIASSPLNGKVQISSALCLCMRAAVGDRKKKIPRSILPGSLVSPLWRTYSLLNGGGIFSSFQQFCLCPSSLPDQVGARAALNPSNS